MQGHNTSCLAQADHYRQLAQWTSDERAHRILLEMARELEEQAMESHARRGGQAPQPIPRSLS